MFKVEKERLILDKISEYRDIGASYSEIANRLNSDGITTLNGKKWSTVYIFRFFNERIKKNRE